MRIKATIERVPGGMMMAPLALGCLLANLAPGAPKYFGSFTGALFTGALPMLAVFYVCMGTTISVQAAPAMVGKGGLLLAAKFLSGILAGVILGRLLGERPVESGFFAGLSTLAVVAAISDTNGGLYMALMGQYGSPRDVGAYSVMTLESGPFLTMIIRVGECATGDCGGSMTKPRIAVTMGDPSGIGPEICLALLNDASIATSSTPIVFGDASVLRRVSVLLGVPFTARVFDARDGLRSISAPSVLDHGYADGASVMPGRVDEKCGDAAYRYVTSAIDAGLAGDVHGISTGPLNKEAMHAAGHKFPGHTEVFAERMKAPRSCMMLTSPELTCSFVTVHVGYRDVPSLLSVQRVTDVIELTVDALEKMKGPHPRLVVCGLNPHSGENGLFGDREEERFLVPAIAAARANGVDIEGPAPSDTAFLPSRRRSTDAFICMYHDQGHIPLKALAFDSAINTTLGLPVIRTSVDHGTAFDIAWQGIASANSLIESVRLAAQLSSGVA